MGTKPQDSPKVPWTLAELALNAYLAADLSGPGSARQHGLERMTAAIGSVFSALLSDEVTEAVLASEEVEREFRRTIRAHDEESLDEAAAYLIRAALTAAIEQVGGGQG